MIDQRLTAALLALGLAGCLMAGPPKTPNQRAVERAARAAVAPTPAPERTRTPHEPPPRPER